MGAKRCFFLLTCVFGGALFSESLQLFGEVRFLPPLTNYPPISVLGVPLSVLVLWWMTLYPALCIGLTFHAVSVHLGQRRQAAKSATATGATATEVPRSGVHIALAAFTCALTAALTNLALDPLYSVLTTHTPGYGYTSTLPHYWEWAVTPASDAQPRTSSWLLNGVPLSNFVVWLLTSHCIFHVFVHQLLYTTPRSTSCTGERRAPVPLPWLGTADTARRVSHAVPCARLSTVSTRAFLSSLLSALRGVKVLHPLTPLLCHLANGLYFQLNAEVPWVVRFSTLCMMSVPAAVVLSLCYYCFDRPLLREQRAYKPHNYPRKKTTKEAHVNCAYGARERRRSTLEGRRESGC
jgi:hypothetical protein